MLTVFDYDSAALEDGFDFAFYLPALVRRIIDVHVLMFDAECVFFFRVENHIVGTGADGDRAFLEKRPNIFAVAVEVSSTKAVARIRLRAPATQNSTWVMTSKKVFYNT